MCSRHRDFYLYVKCMYCLKRGSVKGKDLRWPRACWAVRSHKEEKNANRELATWGRAGTFFNSLITLHPCIREMYLYKVVTSLTAIRLGNIPQRLKHRIGSSLAWIQQGTFIVRSYINWIKFHLLWISKPPNCLHCQSSHFHQYWMHAEEKKSCTCSFWQE